MKISKVLVHWNNFDKIFENFDIFQCEYDVESINKKEGKKGKTKLEENRGQNKQQMKALSVCYKTDGYCLFLLPRTGKNYDMMDDFVSNHKYIKTFEQITLESAKAHREKFFLKDDRALIQLFINSMNMPSKEKYRYNNINGKLYIRVNSSSDTITEDNGYLSFIQFHLTSEMNLEFPLVTFKKSNYGMYVLDKDYNFRYALSEEDKELPHYIKESEDEHRNTIDFMDYSALEKAEDTKVYHIAKFMDKVQQSFSEYFTLDFVDLPYTTYIKNDNSDYYDKTNFMLGKFFQNHGQMYVYNLLPTNSRAENIKDNIIKMFNTWYNVNVQETNVIVPGKLNIVIGHNKKFYVNKKITNSDPYKGIHNDAIVQYVTVEDCNLVEKFNSKGERKCPKFLKIANEIQLKLEILDNKLSHVWQATKNPYTFVYYEVDKHYVEDPETGKSWKEPYDIRFYRMKVNSDDRIEFSHFKYSDSELINNNLDEEAEIVIDYVAELEHKGNGYMQQGSNNGSLHYGESVDGLFYSDINNINTIFKTQFHTLPNYKEIIDDIERTSDDAEIDIEKVTNCIKEFKSQKINTDNIDSILEKLVNCPAKMTYKDFRELGVIQAKGKADWLKEIIDYVYEKENILLALEIRADRRREVYELASVSDIQYFNKERPIYGSNKEITSYIPCFSYIAGKRIKKLNTNVAVGCIIRDVIWQEKCEFENILKMLTVDFVRNDSYYTVLPFPFKYLHEYASMVNLKSIK